MDQEARRRARQLISEAIELLRAEMPQVAGAPTSQWARVVNDKLHIAEVLQHLREAKDRL